MMNPTDSKKALACAVKAARVAGKLMRDNLRETKRINSKTQHDIKLELDIRCQKLITKTLAAQFPQIALLGEEGISGNPEASQRWVVDPIDGTVNFTYGIPHACVSIALQVSNPKFQIQNSKNKNPSYEDGYETIIGVVYDPFCDELWTAIRGQPAKLNGKIIRVSDRKQLRESIVAIGFAKSRASIESNLPYFNHLVRRVRKVRMMGAAALAMVYVASGRFDAYIERGIRLWDIAAGGLIVECAGGEFWHRRIKGDYAYEMLTSNGFLTKKLESIG
ncbi:MAG TPA: inositol monophosphatase family protein [Verrucomicrobiae bacterium]|nr:inositol monophosphatase family protein [Verrucomicrobiae bacterium]